MGNFLRRGKNLSAADGAERAAKREMEDSSRLDVSREKAQPIENALKRLSEIEGIDLSYSSTHSSSPFGGSVDVRLEIESKHYKVRIDSSQFLASLQSPEGYATIFKSQEGFPVINREFEPYEGKHKTLEQTLGAIACIAGSHYPKKADAIDQVMRGTLIADRGPQIDSGRAR